MASWRPCAAQDLAADLEVSCSCHLEGARKRPCTDASCSHTRVSLSLAWLPAESLLHDQACAQSWSCCSARNGYKKPD